MDYNVNFACSFTFVFLIVFSSATPNDYCHPNPCLNGGSCVQVQDGYDCHCDMQFTGAHCEGQIMSDFSCFSLHCYIHNVPVLR